MISFLFLTPINAEVLIVVLDHRHDRDVVGCYGGVVVHPC